MWVRAMKPVAKRELLLSQFREALNSNLPLDVSEVFTACIDIVGETISRNPCPHCRLDYAAVVKDMVDGALGKIGTKGSSCTHHSNYSSTAVTLSD